jgi:hypothetical protein
MSLPTLTFAEFQATGRDVDSVQDELGFVDDRPAQPGRLYCDCLYIERNADGTWSCVVSNDDEWSADRAVVELFLFRAMDGEAFIADWGVQS